MRDRVARKSRYDSRTIARDVLLATGRHPDMRGLNAHLATMQKLLGQHGGDMHGGDGSGGGLGSRSDLATIKWDVIDPEVDEEQENANPRDSSPEEMSRKHRPVKSGSQMPLAHSPGPALTQQHPRLGATDSSSTSNNAPRPSKSHHTSRSASATSTPAAANGDMPPVGYSAFRSYAEDGTLIKKKGRPFGWKKSIHSREAQGLPPKSVTSLPSRKKTATSTPTGSAKKEHVVLQPVYQVYKCRWQQCKAELHNFETLKKHIIKVHGLAREGDERFECWWKGCGVEERAKGRVLSFDGIEDWLAHVDEEHLAAVRWKLGDGPKAGE